MPRSGGGGGGSNLKVKVNPGGSTNSPFWSIQRFGYGLVSIDSYRFLFLNNQTVKLNWERYREMVRLHQPTCLLYLFLSSMEKTDIFKVGLNCYARYLTLYRTK